MLLQITGRVERGRNLLLGATHCRGAHRSDPSPAGDNRAHINENNDHKGATHSSTSLCRFLSHNVFLLEAIKAGIRALKARQCQCKCRELPLEFEVDYWM